MALEGLTKITSIGLAGGIDITGITTTHGMQLSGITTGLAVSGVATFTDNVTVAGTLTYEDVTNIDSVGIITARKGISVSGGGTLDQANITGVSTFTGIIDGNGGANIVGGSTLDQLNVTGISTLTELLVKGGSAAKPTFRHSAGWGALRVAGSAGGSGAGVIFANNYSGTIEEKWSIYLDGSTDDLRFTAGPPETTASEKVRITSAGKVGINSTSPTYALEVDGGTQNTVIAVRSSDAKAAISFLDNTSGGYGRATIGGEGDQVYITSGAGTERIRFGTGGSNLSVGISTTLNLVTNSEVLAVRGTSSFKSHTETRPALYLGNEGSVTDTANPLILFNQGGANRAGIGYVPNTGEFRINNQYFITFTTGASTLGGTERLRITSVGRVLVGTGAVGASSNLVAEGGLQVSTNGASGAPTVCFGADGTSANTQSITNNTIKDFRMGFPNYAIAEEPLAAMCGFVGDGSSDDDNDAGRLYIGGGTSWMNAVNHIRFFTAPSNLTTVTGTERLRITSSGKIGIGITNPARQFEIGGASNADMQISPADGNTGESRIYIGGNSSNQNKCAIIHDPAGGYCRGNLHFCLENSGDLTNVDSSDSKVVIMSNGNLGIGDNDPQSLLSLKASNPTIRFTDGSTLVGAIEGDTAQNAFYGYNGADIVFSAHSGSSYAERFRIDDSGNVYFSGTQTGNNRGIIYNHASGLGIYCSSHSGTNRDLIVYSNSTSGSELFRVSSIGATIKAESAVINRNAGDPYLAFQTSGTSNVAVYGGTSTGFRVFTLPSGGSLSERLKIDTTGTTRLKRSTISNSATTADNAALYLDVADTEGSASSYHLLGFGYRSAVTNAKPAYMGYQSTSWSGHTHGDLVFGTRNSTTGSDEAVERMRIDRRGIVTRPYHSAFKAHGSAAWINFANGWNSLGGSSSGTINPGWSTSNYKGYDNQNEFDETNGRFVATVSGDYYFWYMMYIKKQVATQSNYVHINPYVNGQNMQAYTIYGREQAITNGTHIDGVTGGWSGALAAGDYFQWWVYCDGANNFSLYGGHCLMGGWLIG